MEVGQESKEATDLNNSPREHHAPPPRLAQFLSALLPNCRLSLPSQINFSAVA